MEDEQVLNYQLSGKGTTVVFIHGFMESLEMWDELLPYFSNHRCLTIDLFGHGKSPFNPNLKPSIKEMALQVERILKKEAIENAIVVGHSLGGYVGLELLKLNPSIEHLVLMHSNPWADSPERQADRNRVIELVKTKADLFIQEAIPNLFAFPDQQKTAIDYCKKVALSMSGEQIAWSAAAMRDRENNEYYCGENPGKITVIQGEKDKLIPFGPVKKWCFMTGINYLEIQNVGHMSQNEDPNKLIELLLLVIG